jgi:hypothetical protein
MFFETLWIENFAKKIEEKIMRKFFGTTQNLEKTKSKKKVYFANGIWRAEREREKMRKGSGTHPRPLLGSGSSTDRSECNSRSASNSTLRKLRLPNT